MRSAPKDQRLNLRLSPEDVAHLKALTEALGLADLSSTVRFAVRELCRTKAVYVPPPRKRG